jgi:hypothetical protein
MNAPVFGIGVNPLDVNQRARSPSVSFRPHARLLP